MAQMITDLPLKLSLVRKFLRTGAKQAGKEFITEMRIGIMSGDGQPPYSTRGAWYSIAHPYVPRGMMGKMRDFLRGNAEAQRRAGFTKSASGALKNVQGSAIRDIRAVYLEQGYAQFRAIYKGTSIRTQPVNLNLTGDLLKQLRPVVMLKGDMARIKSGFKRENRNYGTLTNSQLKRELDKRGAHPAFSIENSVAEKIANQTWAFVLGQAQKPTGKVK